MRSACPRRDVATALAVIAIGVWAARAGAVATPGRVPAVADIVAENALPGNPASEWDIVGAGHPSIQGFATDMSYVEGETVEFKIDTDATDYRLDIYRMGWYAGLGARLVDTIQPSATLPQAQPAPVSDAATGLVDCGNWAVSATWVVPAGAVSGIYFAKLVREDPEDGRASHILFVVRDDDGGSDILLQTSDTTWQAYNSYGGNSLYQGSASAPPVPRAHKVSYNRPFVTRDGPLEDWVFNDTYPMVRWLERNGYDVSYTSGIDTDRRGSELLEHSIFVSMGHDEYWSAAQRTAVEAARDAGVHMAFLSGNEIYWKVRWENSIDGSGTPYRTLVCYKEGTQGEITCGTKCDPLPGVWTGLWRSGCEYPAADGCRPENALSGQISWVGSTGAIEVPQADGLLRTWRHTDIGALAPGQVATLTAGSLGYEWDFEQFEAHYPPGRITLSSTTLGGQTHRLSLYRHTSGALVFGAGSVQWSWGLDGNHDRGGSIPDPRMQQATVNLFADMGVQPAALQLDLVAATQSTDTTAPTSSIAAPLAGATLSVGVPSQVMGAAADAGGGVVGAVEVSVDGGATWRRANGRETWTFTWTPTAAGMATLRSRAVDDSGNIEAPGAGVGVTLAVPPPPDEGPGGPILVVADAADSFGRYYCEILRCEGFNAFAVTDVSLVTPAVLADYDVVILASTALSPGDVTLWSDWVDGGGNLIAMRPDAALATLLGLTPAGGTASDAYLLVDTASGPGVGIVGETIQYHGTADRYTAGAATVVATLYSDATTATVHPAVTLRGVGANGGQAACFTFDLARSIVYTRQGNPAWAGQERDGTAPIRSNDLFYGAAAGDPQPDWVDLDKVAIPQADELQRLLANMILSMNADRKPLPRFWYFPRGLEAVVVMTGDNHGSGGMASRFDTYVAQSPAGCSLPDWECVRASGYLYVGPPFSNAQALAYHNLGFEVGLHVNTGCSDWTPASLQSDYTTQLATFAGAYPSVPAPPTNRTHCIAWSDWATQATVAVQNGIRLDTNYYYWPPGWVANRPGMFTGSGMPMRFADLDGTMIDCYQVATQMTDESGQAYPFTVDALLDRALGPEKYYGAFCANMHFDSSPHAASDAIVASALARDVPVVSGRQMLEWVDGRNASSFGGMTWNGSTLDFTVAAANGAHNLRALLPVSTAGGQLLALTHDMAPVAWTTRVIKGVEYALFPAASGGWSAVYGVDSAPPVISNVTATPLGGGMASVTWDTDEPADSRVDYGTAPEALGLSASAGALVTAHAVPLVGLLPNTTYYYRVTSEDASSNAATEPQAPTAPLSFMTPDAPCAVDTDYTDFAAGDVSGGTRAARTTGGEVILVPAGGSEFETPGLPAGFGDAPWQAGGGTSVAAGAATIDGSLFGPTATFGPGSSLEFVATFGAAQFQHVGFTDDFNSTWIIFSTGSTTTDLRARTNPGADVLIPGSWLGSPHRFRIDWKAASIDYWIDGVLVVSHPFAVGGSLRALGSDFAVGGATLAIEWMRVAPYATNGDFVSRIFDAGTSSNWGTVTWTATTPPGTSVAIAARTGETPVPDGTWSAFTAVPTSGASLGQSGRYAQYRATLATGDAAVTPVLEEIALDCSDEADVTPPVITNVTAAPDPTGTAATVTWDTDEPADSRVDWGTSPGSLPFSASAAALEFAHALPLAGLAPGTTYWYRVTSADAESNSATEPPPPTPPLSFTTPVPPCFVDVAVADFEAGSVDAGAYIADTAGGEILLAPEAGTEFSGIALASGWSSFPWSGGGTGTVAAGALTVDGARVNTIPAPGYGPGRALEFAATFAAAPFQHIGFGGGSDIGPGEIFNTSPWAMFSTGSAGTALQARVWAGGPFIDFTVPGAWLGAEHRYRIDWNPGGFDFWIDGVLVHSEPVAIADPMRPAISDFAVGGATLVADWIRMSAYAAAGTFESRVFDAGAVATWGTATWSSDEPPGTSLAVAVRTGDTPVPGGSWSLWSVLPGSGSSVGASARYIQYRAALATSDAAHTPALLDMSIVCAVCADTLAPAALAGVAATRVATGNDADGTTRIEVTFPATDPGAIVHLYRKGFGNYPQYDDAPGAGSVPPAPATPAAAVTAGWALAASLTGGETSFVDEPPLRDFWYFVAFVEDECGNVSAVSNRTGGTLDYILGDSSDGVTPGNGNNRCSTEDLSDLGAHYGAEEGEPLFRADLDIGPTTSMTVEGRPTTDDRLDFEDLILLAVNYTHVVAKSRAALTPAAVDELIVLVPEVLPARGETFDVTLRMSGTGAVQGVHVELGWNAGVVTPVASAAGAWTESQGGIVLSSRPGIVDAALLGRRSLGLAGEGVLATIQFRVAGDGDAQWDLARVTARDGHNRDVALPASLHTGTPETTVVPQRTALLGGVPNPFNPSTSVRFDLATPGRVRLAVYDVNGRVVRTLCDEMRAAGAWSVTWDGRDAHGNRAASGVYLVRMQAVSYEQTCRVTLLK